MIRNQRWSSLRPVELTVTAAVLAVLASAASPTQLHDRIAANEASAIAALRSIAAAQAEFKAAVDIETNCDGIGEYGYFAELAGSEPMRVGFQCAPAAGAWPNDLLNPPLLRSSFGILNGSCVSHHGYLFQMWLPAATVGGMVSGVREDWTGGKAAAPFPDSLNGARMWCCYAWPMSWNHSGRRAFFINQRGAVLQFANRNAAPFNGMTKIPGFDEAYSVPGDMGSPVRIGAYNADGTIWWPVH